MLTLHIPGREPLILSHLILDYNGTIALDGAVLESVKSRITTLAQVMKVYVITADTHGTAQKHCQGLPVEVLTYPVTEVGAIKAAEVAKLTGGVACIGNGYNDIQMSDVCDLSICVMGREGCCGALISHCDVVVGSIEDGLDLLLKPGRLRATLRT